MTSTIPLDECVDHGLYRLLSRNLSYGVFRKDCNGFVGLRNKFGLEYLSVEYHRDIGLPLGSASPKGLVGTCPIYDLREVVGTRDAGTLRDVAFDKMRGWYFLDTDESSDDIRAVAVANQKLFVWMRGAVASAKDAVL
jgi:hypothetical protein